MEAEIHDITKDKLIADVRVLLADTEELLKATASQTSEKLAELRPRIVESLRAARSRLAEAEQVVVDKTKAAARATDRFVHENPWKAVGIAAAVGILVGLLINRR